MERQPNILLLTTDQQRYDTIAAMGYPYMHTPHLDRLVREGCSVPLAYSPNPACIPARHSLITGQYSAVTGMDDNYFDSSRRLPRGLPTLAGILTDSGYETVAVGKMHFLSARNHNGFGRMELMEEIPRYLQDDDYALYLREKGEGNIQSLHGVRNVLAMLPQNPIQAEEHSGTRWVADRLIHHLNINGGRRPFFYWGSWIAPHPPFSVPKRYADLYCGKDLPEAIPPEEHPKPPTVENSRLADYYDDTVRRRAREYYYGAITQVDEQIGRVLETLAEIGQLDNTLIIFSSDHGELLGDHGSYQKFQPYEGSARIPLVLRWPRHLAPGSTYEGFADLCDLLPTILDAAGVTYPGELPLPGGSLLEAVRNHHVRDFQYIEQRSGARRWISIRNFRYKYNYYYAQGLEELFDLEKDPQERCNLLEVPKKLPQEEYRKLKERLYQMESRWGPAGLTKDGKFQVFGPVETGAKLPATFPLFGKHLPETEELLPLWREILLAVQKEPAVDLRKLRWDEWLSAGLVDQELVDKVLSGAARQL